MGGIFQRLTGDDPRTDPLPRSSLGRCWGDRSVRAACGTVGAYVDDSLGHHLCARRAHWPVEPRDHPLPKALDVSRLAGHTHASKRHHGAHDCGACLGGFGLSMMCWTVRKIARLAQKDYRDNVRATASFQPA